MKDGAAKAAVLPFFDGIMEVDVIKKPNSLCKNINCRKPFYACAFCTRTNAWRSVACSFECYKAYGEQVLEARAVKKKVNLLPERIDMSEAEMAEFMKIPIEEAMEITNEELKGYNGSIADIVTEINEEIDAAADENTIIENVNAVATSVVTRKNRKKKQIK